MFEHRYYGESFPVKNLTTGELDRLSRAKHIGNTHLDAFADSLRYLTTMQSLKDSAYFAENIAFPGLELKKLTVRLTCAFD